MATFNQQNQQVHFQYNAETINFGAVQNIEGFVTELENARQELERARDYQVIDVESSAQAEMHLNKAIDEAKKPSPDKETLIEQLKKAKTFIEGVAALGGLVAALAKAVELIRQLL